jgi:hypothetical protein
MRGWTKHPRAGDGGGEAEDGKSSSDTTADQSKKKKTGETRDRWNYAMIFTKGRKLSTVLVPLEIIVNRSLDTGEIPDDWRTANVTTIFKKRPKGDLGNYRPVSLS